MSSSSSEWSDTLIRLLALATRLEGEGQYNPSFASLFLWANSGGQAHSFASYRAWLRDAGFGVIKQLGERWLSAVK